MGTSAMFSKKEIEPLNHYDYYCVKVIKRHSNIGCQTNKHSQIITSLFKIQLNEVFLIQEWPKFGQQQKHTQTTLLKKTKDE
jgi:hypothetical protein